MKATYIRNLIAVAITLLTCACVQEQLEKGAPDLDGCMGVYFVEGQENIKDHTFDMGEGEPSLEFIVRRAVADTAVSVPYTYSVYWIDKTMEEGDTAYVEVPLYDLDKFKFDKSITFAKGQRETKVKVSFDGITTGKRFRCTMNISDPRYVSSYSANPASISFSVQMNEWVKMSGKATYRDALFSDIFAWNGRYLQNSDVEVYQRKDRKHHYKFKGLYSSSYLVRLIEGEEEYSKNKKELEETYAAYFSKNVSIELDATDSTKVFFPLQKIGFTHPSYGATYVASDVAEVVGASSNLLYGTRSEDGIITFPKNGVLLGLGGTFYFCNTSGKLRIVLPGAKAEDYDIEMSGEDVSEGQIPVKFTVAKDVRKVKYSLFKGRINAVAMADSLKKVESDGIAFDIPEGTTETEKSVSPKGNDAKTGIYTLVACSYGKGDTKYREYSSIEVGYVKPGDEQDHKVQITIGMHTDDQYASDKESENYSSENSFQFWIRGKDITHALVTYYPTAYYKTYEKLIKENILSGSYGTIDGASLQMLNGKGLSNMIGNTLEANTSYTMLVYAGNGYYSEFFTESIKTGGKTDFVQKTYFASDIKEFSQPDVDSYNDTWVPVSIDIFDAKAKGRTLRGNWRAREVKLNVDGDIVTASGLFPALSTNPDVRFELKEGLLYTRENRGAAVKVKDSTNIVPSMRLEYSYIPKTTAVTGSGSVVEKFDDDQTKDRRDMMMGGFVHEDIIAFVDNTTEYQFWALTMGGFQKDRMGKENMAAIIGDAHGQLILIRKSNTELLKGLTEKESKGLDDIKTLGSAAETHAVTLPAPRELPGDQIRFDRTDRLVEFRQDARIKGNIDINNLK